MAGEVATIGTFSFFPSKNLGGYGDGGMMVTQDERLCPAAPAAAHARRREDLLPRGSRLQLAARCAAGRGAAGQAAAPGRVERAAARERGVLHRRRSRTWRRSCARRSIAPANESIFNQYTIRAARRDRAAGAPQRARHRHVRSIIRFRCTCSPASRISAYRAGQFPESERAAAEVLSLPVYPELTTAQQDEVIAAVRAFYGE